PSLTGRFHLFVRADANDEVFEASQEANNILEADSLLDVMPVPYADLRVSELEVPSSAFSGGPLTAAWSVVNDGIGLTTRGDWIDRLYLARNADGSDPYMVDDRIYAAEFQHFGQLSPDGDYERVGAIALPD